MSRFEIGRTPRIRPSPYFDATVKAGLKGVTVYNHMILPTEFSGMADEYDALVNDVTIWDVGSERQVEIEGPDALALTQYLCTRDVRKVDVGQARYTFICNHEGGILNDPVLLRVDEDRFWLSLADRDILLWVQAIAGERDLGRHRTRARRLTDANSGAKVFTADCRRVWRGDCRSAVLPLYLDPARRYAAACFPDGLVR